MKIIHKNEAKKFENGNVFTAYEYDTQVPELNLAKIEINGRFPSEGTMRNTKVMEMVYVESGSGEVSINGKREKVSAGDVISFHKNEHIFWKGNFTLIIACSPAWSPDQHEFIS